MKISMEIKDVKIVLTDEQPEETKHLTETITISPNTFTGTGVDLKKTYGIELNKPEKEPLEQKSKSNNIKTVKDILDNEDTTKKELIDASASDEKEEIRKKNIIVKEAFETKLDEMKNPNRFNTGQVMITMPTVDRPDIDQIADIDNGIPGYDRIRAFESMGRKCDLTIINDGYDSSNDCNNPNEENSKINDALYFMVNRTGFEPEKESWSQNEIMIYPGEPWKIYDVYELRIRSETQKTRYRITEDDIIATSTIRSVS